MDADAHAADTQRAARQSVSRLVHLIRGLPFAPDLAAALTGLAGLLALVAAIFLPWFTVPGLTSEPWPSAIYRGLCIAALLATVARPVIRQRALLALLIALLLFPYFVTIWSPTVAGQASWLQAQHESLTGSSGDIFLSQETRDAAWRQRVDIVNRPIDAAIFELPDWTTADWGRVLNVFEWFGGSVWFASFARSGWVLATAGAAFCLLAMARRENSARRLLRQAVTALAIALTLALIPPALSIGALWQARVATARGDSSHALAWLHRAAVCLPAIREDGYYALQRGLLDSTLGRPTPEAAFFQARQLELRGLEAQAQGRYLAGLSTPDASPAVTREYLKALLSRAADLSNSGQVLAAAELLQTVLAHDPTNLKALHALQLARVRTADLPAVRALDAEIVAVYRSFNNPTKKAVLALAHENVAFAAQLDGDFPGAERALARARQP